MKRHAASSVAAVAVISALATVALVATPASGSSCVQVDVQNVRPEQGTLWIAAYADAASFNKTPAASMQLRASSAAMTFPICDLAGVASIALTLYQDLNGNGKLDRNVFGMPSEPWGASGKPAAMSAPTWETTAVPLDGSTIVIQLSK